MSTTTRTPLEERLYTEGAADAAAGADPTPPTMGGKAETAYLAGYSSATKKPAPKKTPAKKAPAKKKPAPKKTSRARSSSTTRRATPGGRAARTAASRVTRPAERQLANGLTVLATAVAIAVGLNLLRNATYASSALTGLSKIVDWLDSPRPIPYRK